MHGNWGGAKMGHLITLGQNEENKTPKNSVKKGQKDRFKGLFTSSESMFEIEMHFLHIPRLLAGI